MDSTGKRQRRLDEENDQKKKTKLGDSNTDGNRISKNTNFAQKYLKIHGYKEGAGLGKHGDGIIEPVEASTQKGRRGLGYAPDGALEALSEYEPQAEKISLDEEVIWLPNNYNESLDRETLSKWLKLGPSQKNVMKYSNFCDSSFITKLLQYKKVLDGISEKEKQVAKGRANPFESIRSVIFLNRAAMKMANLDAILDRMFTEPKDSNGKAAVGPNELLYFADVCAGPGGFSEYVFYRKKWMAKGFGFTLKEGNDFALEKFWAGPSETFHPFYGKNDDGNVYDEENIKSLKDFVLKETRGKGVHFMMADGGVAIEENISDQELICKKLYLCQCLVALLIVRAEGHFVVKLFDLFTDFSVGLVYLMYRSFKEISIIKPNTSRPANSERYLVCKWKRTDCQNIADHLLSINKNIPEYRNQTRRISEQDVLELVSLDDLRSDDRFFSFIKSSNETLAEKQIVSLRKFVAFTENVNSAEETQADEKKQADLRKKSLEKWRIPDQARVEPKKSEARVKWLEFVESTSMLEWDARNSVISSVEQLKKAVVFKEEWRCFPLSREDCENSCTFFLGLGRSNVCKYENGRWTKSNDLKLVLPADTIIYAESLQEFVGSAKAQRKIGALHILDGLVLGKEKIFHLPLAQRLEKCKLFAEALSNEMCPVRMKDHVKLTEMESLWNRLVLRSTKSSKLQQPSIQLSQNSFYQVRGMAFIKDNQQKQNSSKAEHKNYFEECFKEKLIWRWSDGVVVHEDQSFPPRPEKLQRADIDAFLRQS